MSDTADLNDSTVTLQCSLSESVIVLTPQCHMLSREAVNTYSGGRG
jgi:hypothetical protein